MVSQLVARGSSSRQSSSRLRRRGSRGGSGTGSQKTKRYPDSDSADDDTASSMDSTVPNDGVERGSTAQFPARLFAPGFFPTQLRLNIYSKANVIGSVASALEGSAAMDVLLRSQFGKLFLLPVARCHNSTKLIGSLLCRQLIMARKYELWFVFGDHPIRFSLDEFKYLTGLNCESFDVEDSEIEENIGSSMWSKLFDTVVGEITVGQVLQMLKNLFLAEWKRIPLALIALVDGVLCCSNKTLKLTPKYVEMLNDVDSFMTYPWGRTSFLHTISRFLPPLVIDDIPDLVDALRIRLSQKTTACYGFPLAIQLLALEAFSQLLARIPSADNKASFLQNPEGCANTLAILNTDDIVAVEKQQALTVKFSLVPETERFFWLDEVEDTKVSCLVDYLSSGHTFTSKDFEGGDKSFGKGNAMSKDKTEGGLILQRNLLPRKRAAVIIEDLTTSEQDYLRLN